VIRTEWTTGRAYLSLRFKVAAGWVAFLVTVSLATVETYDRPLPQWSVAMVVFVVVGLILGTAVRWYLVPQRLPAYEVQNKQPDPVNAEKSTTFEEPKPTELANYPNRAGAKHQHDKVLLISNDLVRGQVWTEILTQRGYIVHNARHWNDAVEISRPERFKFTVADSSVEHLKEPLSRVLAAAPVIFLPDAQEGQFAAFVEQFFDIERDLARSRLIPNLAFNQKQTVHLPPIVKETTDTADVPARHSRRYSYGYIGTEDFTMYPLLWPGTLVQIDEEKTRVQQGPWRAEYERPIYFVETREGFVCCWCVLRKGEIMLQSHPLSPVPLRVMKHPQEAEVIGQVVGISMWLPAESAFLKDLDVPNTAQTKSDVEEQIAAIWEQELGIKYLDAGATLHELGADLPARRAIGQAITNRFGVDLGEKVIENSTVSELAGLIMSRPGARAVEKIEFHPHRDLG
jgi:hypothetical protein